MIKQDYSYNFSNNVKMINFSQAQSQRSKQDNTKSYSHLKLDFKIQQPNDQRKFTNFTSQISISECSQAKGECSFRKNAFKSFSKDRKIQQQYISFKLKPTKNSEGFKITSKEKKYVNQKPQLSNPKNSKESRQDSKNLQSISFTKSPEFLSKLNSQQSSFKHSFNHQNHPWRVNKQPQNTFGNKNQFINEKDVSFQHSARKNNKQLEKYEDYSPYQQLKEQFEKQQKFYETQCLFNQRPEQFDSFNQQYQLHSERSEKKQKPQKNQQNFDYFDSFSVQNHQQSKKEQTQNYMKKGKQQVATNSKKGFFFLTNPPSQSDNKKNKDGSKTQRAAIQTNESNPNKVQQFCFNLSSIKFQNQKKVETPNPNLFSNPNELLCYFDSKGSKNLQKSELSVSSKKGHVRQLVQEFIDQLQHLDERSLNEKVVNNLENVLQQIVFKEPKLEINPVKIKIEDQKKNRLQSSQQQNKFYDIKYPKKWFKTERQFDFGEARTERKPIMEFYHSKDKTLHSAREHDYSFKKIEKYQNYIPTNLHDRSPSYQNKSTERKHHDKETVYKPNFNFSKPRIKTNTIYQNQNNVTPTKFLNMNRRPEPLAIKINPKSSIYVKRGAQSSREHLKTQYNHPKTRKIY